MCGRTFERRRRPLIIGLLFPVVFAACAEEDAVAPKAPTRRRSPTSRAPTAVTKTDDKDEGASEWPASDALACRSPMTKTACAAVAQFIKTHPTGPASDDAREILKAASTPGKTWCEESDSPRLHLVQCVPTADTRRCRRWHCINGSGRVTPWEDDHPNGPDDCADEGVPIQLAWAPCGFHD